MARFIFMLVAALLLGTSALAASRPNVIVMVADDLGWNDVGFHGGDIETPSLDRLAAEGMELNRFYTTPICSPTRAALMTGRALTASELAQEAGITPQTASSHLAKLEAGGLIEPEKQGRHRYYRLSDPDVADVLEGLQGQLAPQFRRNLPPLQGLQQASVLLWTGEHAHMGVVLGCGAHHGGPADVDLFNCLIPAHIGPGDRGFKRIEIHHHQLDGGDVLSLEIRPV